MKKFLTFISILLLISVPVIFFIDTIAQKAINSFILTPLNPSFSGHVSSLDLNLLKGQARLDFSATLRRSNREFLWAKDVLVDLDFKDFFKEWKTHVAVDVEKVEVKAGEDLVEAAALMESGSSEIKSGYTPILLSYVNVDNVLVTTLGEPAIESRVSNIVLNMQEMKGSFQDLTATFFDKGKPLTFLSVPEATLYTRRGEEKTLSASVTNPVVKVSKSLFNALQKLPLPESEKSVQKTKSSESLSLGEVTITDPVVFFVDAKMRGSVDTIKFDLPQGQGTIQNIQGTYLPSNLRFLHVDAINLGFSPDILKAKKKSLSVKIMDPSIQVSHEFIKSLNELVMLSTSDHRQAQTERKEGGPTSKSLPLNLKAFVVTSFDFRAVDSDLRTQVGLLDVNFEKGTGVIENTAGTLLSANQEFLKVPKIGFQINGNPFLNFGDLKISVDVDSPAFTVGPKIIKAFKDLPDPPAFTSQAGKMASKDPSSQKNFILQALTVNDLNLTIAGKTEAKTHIEKMSLKFSPGGGFIEDIKGRLPKGRTFLDVDRIGLGFHQEEDQWRVALAVKDPNFWISQELIKTIMDLTKSVTPERNTVAQLQQEKASEKAPVKLIVLDVMDFDFTTAGNNALSTHVSDIDLNFVTGKGVVKDISGELIRKNFNFVNIEEVSLSLNPDEKETTPLFISIKDPNFKISQDIFNAFKSLPELPESTKLSEEKSSTPLYSLGGLEVKDFDVRLVGGSGFSAHVGVIDLNVLKGAGVITDISIKSFIEDLTLVDVDKIGLKIFETPSYTTPVGVTVHEPNIKLSKAVLKDLKNLPELQGGENQKQAQEEKSGSSAPSPFGLAALKVLGFNFEMVDVPLAAHIGDVDVSLEKESATVEDLKLTYTKDNFNIVDIDSIGAKLLEHKGEGNPVGLTIKDPDIKVNKEVINVFQNLKEIVSTGGSSGSSSGNFPFKPGALHVTDFDVRVLGNAGMKAHVEEVDIDFLKDGGNISDISASLLHQKKEFFGINQIRVNVSQKEEEPVIGLEVANLTAKVGEEVLTTLKNLPDFSDSHKKNESKSSLPDLSELPFTISGISLTNTALYVLNPGVRTIIGYIGLDPFEGTAQMGGVSSTLLKEDLTFLTLGELGLFFDPSEWDGSEVPKLKASILDFNLKVSKNLISELKKLKNEDQKKKEEPKLPFHIEEILVGNSSVSYLDFPGVGGQEFLTIDDIFGSIENISLEPGTPLGKFAFNATFEGDSKLLSQGRFDLADNPKQWSVDGKLLGFDLVKMNTELRQRIPLTFDEGNLSAFAEAVKRDDKIVGYVKPFIKDASYLWNPNDFKSARHFFVEMFARFTNWVFENDHRNSIATKVPFTFEEGKLDVDVSQAGWRAVEHGLLETDTVDRGLLEKFQLKEAQEENPDKKEE